MQSNSTTPVLPPGTLLQLMYLKARLRNLPSGRFIEVGPGSGEITKLLLGLGWTGRSFDLDATTVALVNERFAFEVAAGKYSAEVNDFLSVEEVEGFQKADLVISCMVMEHLDDLREIKFMETAERLLSPEGLLIGLVPSSPRHWGIEDEIAGHFRRYTFDSVKALMSRSRWSVRHLAGLTYPVSNMLLPVSEFLVERSERTKLELSKHEQTKASGRRNVRFKTHFPSIFRMVLNRYVLFIFHVFQCLFKHSERSLVIYFESVPEANREPVKSNLTVGKVHA
jgi:SAM-dependent methyltransferase